MDAFWGMVGFGLMFGILFLCIGIADGISRHGFHLIEIHKHYHGKDGESE